MANSYVCSGATMRCTMGTSQARLTVLPIRTVFLTGKPQANISDHISFVNLGAFGRCRSLGFPATAAATAAAHGKLTPMPCMHNTPFPWMGGKNDYIVKGDPALLKSSTCQCMWGGTISLVTDGQTPTGPADLSHLQTEKFEKDQVSAKGLSTDEVLDGIQMALDVAGMVPLAGAVPDLLNAAISACRGNWADAGLSLLAAVPGVGDVAGGAKIVKNGVKIAKNVKNGAEATEIGAKVLKDSKNLAKNTEHYIPVSKMPDTKSGSVLHKPTNSNMESGMKRGTQMDKVSGSGGKKSIGHSGTKQENVELKNKDSRVVATKEKTDIEKKREELEKIFKGDDAERPAIHNPANKEIIESLERAYKSPDGVPAVKSVVPNPEMRKSLDSSTAPIRAAHSYNNQALEMPEMEADNQLGNMNRPNELPQTKEMDNPIIPQGIEKETAQRFEFIPDREFIPTVKEHELYRSNDVISDVEFSSVAPTYPNQNPGQNPYPNRYLNPYQDQYNREFNRYQVLLDKEKRGNLTPEERKELEKLKKKFESGSSREHDNKYVGETGKNERELDLLAKQNIEYFQMKKMSSWNKGWNGGTYLEGSVQKNVDEDGNEIKE